MGTLQHADSSGNPPNVIAYIDTVELFFRRWPKGISRIRWLHPNPSAVIVHKCLDRNGEVCGFRAIVHQPTKEIIKELDRMQSANPHSTLCRFDPALDTVNSSPDEFKKWLVKHVVLNRRPRDDLMHKVGDTIYWTSQSGRMQFGKKKRSQRDVAVYSDRPSKISGESCAHLELRFYGTSSVRRAAYPRAVYSRVADLLELKPRELFEKHLRLATFDAEPIIQKFMRAAVKEDREFYRGKKTSKSVDRYRANIPRRVRALVERITLNSAQLMHDILRIKGVPISLDVLNIPETLTFPDDNQQSAYPVTKLHKHFNDTQSRTPSQRKVKSMSQNDG